MSTKLGTLTLDLVAKIGNFVEPMNQAEKKAKGTSQTIADSFNVSTLAVNALGVAFAGVTVGGLAAFTNQIIDTGNEIKKLSQLSNTSTFDFQFYAKGAETAGMSMESFADKMKDMQDRIGDFQQSGGGPLADFFTNIAPLVGVTIEQFQKLSGPEALQLFYNSLEKVGATQNDMKFYMESIISDSSLLIPLLENGGEGFKKWGQAASDAGAIMSDEMVDKLALAKENMQMLDLQFDGMQVSLINSFAPTILTVANNLDVVAVAGSAVVAFLTAKMMPALIADTTLKIANALATRNKAVADYEIAKSNLAATVAMVRSMGVTNAQTAAMITNANAALKQAAATRTAALASTSMIGILGGPVGLALTVATVAGSYLLFRDNTGKSTVSLRENNETVEQAIQKYNELDKIKRAAQLVEEREKLEELSDSYEEANSKLISYTLNVVRSSDMTSEQASKFSSLVMDYKAGKITLEELSDAVNKSTALSKDEKDAFIKKAASVRDASNEVNKHKNLVSQMIEKDKQLIKTNNDVADSIDRRGAALLKLTQKERDVYNSIGQELERENYINANVSRGLMSREQAEYFADKRSDAGVAYNERLSKVMFSQIEASWKLAQNTEKRVEAEKKITEEQKKKADFAERNYSYSKSDLEILERVSKLNAEHGLNKISAKRGVPDNLVAAVIAQESGGLINAKSPTGAIGPGQTTSIFRKQYGLSVADSYDVKKVADAISMDLAKSFEVFGNWTDAITAYNAGVGGTKSLNATGFTTSISKTKEAKNYAPSVDKWFTALNGSSIKGSGLTGKEAVLSIKELGEYWESVEDLKKKSLERQKSVSQQYFDEEQKLSAENEDAKKEIQEAYAGDQDAVNKYLKLQELSYQKDLKAFKKAQQEKAEAAFTAYQTVLSEMQSIGMNATAMATLNPMEYQKWDLNNQQQAGYSQLADSFLLAQQAINENEVLAETERYAELTILYETYLQNKAALAEQYAIEEQNFAQTQHQNQLQMWGTLVGQAQNTWGMMTQSIKDASGEQSKEYKTMFAMQQAFALASAIISTEEAASKALTMGPILGIPMASVVRAMGYVNVGVIAAQTVAGMAHDGIDSIPNEGTWLLDKGERVVDARTNADLKSYLESSNGSGGEQQSQPITIINQLEQDSLVGSYMRGAAGGRILMNFIKENPSDVRAALGV